MDIDLMTLVITRVEVRS